jgi:beta-glucosidase/6-phospho-beta-glucosidase/beta-galactosidase
LNKEPLFQTYFGGGFECSSHRLCTGKRLDLIAATEHDKYAGSDYAALRKMGMGMARDGIRWHLIEQKPGHYDFSTVLPVVRAARDSEVQVIWDICHYGYPDDIDIYKPEFIKRFVRFAEAFIRLLGDETDDVPFICPINEISYWAWAGGDMGGFKPCEYDRSFELKIQLVRAAIAAIEAMWRIDDRIRIVHADPAIHVIAHPDRPKEAGAAEGFRQAQYHAWDMLSGRIWPQAGGQPKYLDILGINYYPRNQWFYQGETIFREDPHYRPFHNILTEIYDRYERPMLIAETGDEGDGRPGWLSYMGQEVRTAIELDVPVEGICLYPILNHYHWEDGLYRHSGLWEKADADGRRPIYVPLAEELEQQQRLFDELFDTLKTTRQEQGEKYEKREQTYAAA